MTLNSILSFPLSDTHVSVMTSSRTAGYQLKMQAYVIILENSQTSHSVTACIIGGTTDNQLFLPHITKLTSSSLFLSTEAIQVHVQSLVISNLDIYSLLVGLSLHSLQPLQLIQKLFSHTIPLTGSLHWILVNAQIRIHILMLAYKVKKNPAPSLLNTFIIPHTAPCTL